VLCLIGLNSAVAAQRVGSQQNSPKALLKQADTAYESGDRERARRLYQQVLERDSFNSRAVYQLGLLAPKGSQEAVTRFRHYTELEPNDPWGYMALGDALARAGAVEKAIAEYNRARRIAPSESDVYVGLGRILHDAGRRDELIENYEAWTAKQPGNAQAWFELGEVRRKARRYQEAAEAYAESLALKENKRSLQRLEGVLAETALALQPYYGTSTDSDDNDRTGFGLKADWPLTRRSRWGVHYENIEVENPSASAAADELALSVNWWPRHTFRLDALAGVSRLDGEVPDQNSTDHSLLRLNARWRSPSDGFQAALKVTRYPLTSTPGLVAEPVEFEEYKATFEFPISGPYRFRVQGKEAELESNIDLNERSGYQLGLVYRWRPAVEFNTTFSQLRFDAPTLAGYFAPRRVETIEIGTYFEYWGLWPFSLAVDAGLGLQRVARHGEPFSDASGTFRLWTILSWALKPGVNLNLEIEHEDSEISATALSPTANWEYTSVVLSLRFGVRPRSARSFMANRADTAATLGR
jgi:tetratricopeptide (TPR) repeat protein